MTRRVMARQSEGLLVARYNRSLQTERQDS